MNRLARIFVNPEEQRPRALWRLLLNVLVALGLALGLAGALMPFGDLEFLFDEDPLPGPRLLTEGLAVLLIVGGSVLLCGFWIDKRKLRDFGFRFKRRWWIDFAFGAVLGFGLLSVVFTFEYALGMVQVQGVLMGVANGGPFWFQIACMLLFFVMVSVGEELLSRGYHLKNIAEGLDGVWGLGRRGAPLVAVAFSSLVFALLHAFNDHATMWSTMNLALAGVALAAGMLLTGELAIPIGLHLTWNFTQGNVFGFPVSGNDAGPTFIAIEQLGPDWLTGGEFGPEGGAIGTIMELLGILLIVLWVHYRPNRADVHAGLIEPELRTRSGGD